MSANITTFSKPVDTEIKDVSEQVSTLSEHIGNFTFIDGGENPSNWNNAFASTSNTIKMYKINNSRPVGAPTGVYQYGTLLAVTKDASSYMTHLLFFFTDFVASSSSDAGIFVRGKKETTWTRISGVRVDAVTE